MFRDGCGQPGHRTLKLTVSREWLDGMNKVFACWCQFRKAKSSFKDFWVDAVKIRCGHLDPKIFWISLWIEQIFFMLTVMQQPLVRPTLYSISLIFKCQLTAVLLIKPMVVAGKVLWNRVCPSLPPDICLGVDH